MRANVLNDPAHVKHAGRFAWLSIDTEKAQNQHFLEKFPVDNWPTFFFVDPSTEKAALKWAGSLDVRQLEKLLDDGELAVRSSGGNTTEAALALGDRAYGEGRASDAAGLYRKALQTAPKDWPRRPRAVSSLLSSLRESGAYKDCAEEALKNVQSLPRTAESASIAADGLQCAIKAPSEGIRRHDLIVGLEGAIRASLTIADLTADDRGGFYELLVQAAKIEGDKARAKELASEWLGFEEAQAAKARTPEQRAAFDTYRVAAASELGEPERAIPALQASERDLPRDYNPPLRLASVYTRLGRYDDALKAADRANSKAYGPRKLLVYQIKGNIYLKQGEQQKARRVLEEGLKVAMSLPRSQRSPARIAQLQALLNQVRGPSAQAQ
jgi:hypothetical protein